MKWRSGFSMITAIFVMVMIATVAMFVFSLSGKIVKSTTMQYQREQAMLLAKSYTEYAILAVTANDRNSNCLHTIHGEVGDDPQSGDGYKATVEIQYIGNASATNGCGTMILSNTVQTPQSPLSIIVDTYIEYKDIDNTNGQWLTYHRRTLQKI